MVPFKQAFIRLSHEEAHFLGARQCVLWLQTKYSPQKIYNNPWAMHTHAFVKDFLIVRLITLFCFWKMGKKILLKVQIALSR